MVCHWLTGMECTSPRGLHPDGKGPLPTNNQRGTGLKYTSSGIFFFFKDLRIGKKRGFQPTVIPVGKKGYLGHTELTTLSNFPNASELLDPRSRKTRFNNLEKPRKHQTQNSNSLRRVHPPMAYGQLSIPHEPQVRRNLKSALQLFLSPGIPIVRLGQ